MKTYLYRIHPGIGIARLGNHPDAYFIGPEAPGIAPKGPYKQDGLIKRQAIRFRVFRYTYDDTGLTDVREITVGDNVKIHWTAHLVNKKAASEVFPPQPNGRLRNSDVQKNRFRLVIDSGNQSISGASQKKTLEGSFLNTPVKLGELHTDDKGRLIALGGFGESRSVPPSSSKLCFANNDNWCDDVSDGPVTATIEIERGTDKGLHEADSAWMVVAPPAFAPEIRNVVTWYDRALDLAVRNDPGLGPKKVSFVEHILPILSRTVALSWVDNYADKGHGPDKQERYFLQSDRLKELADNGEESRGYRDFVFRELTDPSAPSPSRSMPELNAGLSPEDPTGPKVPSSLTSLQLQCMKLWAQRRFESGLVGGKPPTPKPLEDLKKADVPAALDRAALDDSIGLAFYPGIECGFIMARGDTYDRPFRISSDLSAGDLTAGLAVPWQADFNACDGEQTPTQPYTWWPAARPNHVFADGASDRHDWVPESFSNRSMVDDWWKLGFIVPNDANDGYVEKERDDSLDLTG